MTPTQQWLDEFARTGSETAFQHLVASYIDLTYSCALRLVDGDVSLAQDVAQLVFIDLARMAPRLSREVMLGGWLHRHTCFVAKKLMRSERRRRARERQALDMNALHQEPSASLADIAPLLDQAINGLNAVDRAAIVLRFFEQKDFRTVGQLLGTSENTARMRVNRAVEKLGAVLKRRGVACSAAALGSTLATNAITAAPVGMATAIATAAISGASASAGLGLTLLKFMGMTKLQFGVAAAAVTVLTTALIVQHQRQLNLRNENSSLLRQVATLQSEQQRLANRFGRAKSASPRLPAPETRPAVASAEPPSENLALTNLYARLRDLPVKLTAPQLEAYLAQNRRNAASLLAGYRTTGETALLDEAMLKFPDNPQVAFEAVLKKNSSPDEQRHWLDTFKRTDPGNALANYLSAADHFKSGRRNEAVEEFIAASGKPLHDYTSERYQDDAEAYLASGYSVADAKTVAGYQLLLPHLAQIKQLGLNMVDLAKAYQQTGDTASADNALQMVVDLGQHYSSQTPGEPAISQLVGIALERMALDAMNPDSPYGSTGQSVQDRLNQLTGQRKELQALYSQAEILFPKMSTADWINYRDRWLMFGENNAVRWVINKYGQL